MLAGLQPPRTHKAVVDTLADEEIQKLLQRIDRTTAADEWTVRDILRRYDDKDFSLTDATRT